MDLPTRIEPAYLSSVPTEVADALADLATSSAQLGLRLHPAAASALAARVRIMNCYYSNLIEGHDTRPRDIERALVDDLDVEPHRRSLQLEARAHVRVQAEIDRQALRGELPEPASADFIRWLHREFYRDAPPEMLEMHSEHASFSMAPGEWRSRPEHDVAVGRHLPPDSHAVEAFMAHFEERYRFEGLGQGAMVLMIPAAHHRLNFIHPFPDGNGRVSRLMSHAMALKAGIGAHGLWSISRGLARGLESRGDYKRLMDYADSPRQGDLDGRGSLSEKALREFTLWFLRVCVDQVRFMAGLFDLDNLSRRYRRYISQSDLLRPEAALLIEEALLRGQVERGAASRVTGLPERSARRVLNETVKAGLLASESPKGPVFPAFPDDALDVLFPQLYPES